MRHFLHPSKIRIVLILALLGATILVTFGARPGSNGVAETTGELIANIPPNEGRLQPAVFIPGLSRSQTIASAEDNLEALFPGRDMEGATINATVARFTGPYMYENRSPAADLPVWVVSFRGLPLRLASTPSGVVYDSGITNYDLVLDATTGKLITASEWTQLEGLRYEGDDSAPSE